MRPGMPRGGAPRAAPDVPWTAASRLWWAFEQFKEQPDVPVHRIPLHALRELAQTKTGSREPVQCLPRVRLAAGQRRDADAFRGVKARS
jgi:hypothetical protein